jgi:phage terminase large subunit GpA-like protein
MIELSESIRRRFEPKPRWTVSEWATRRPFWIVEKGAEAGVYDLHVTPYMREPIDACGDPGVRRANWVVCPQGGKTKAAEVVIAWFLDYKPRNMIYIRPTEPDIDEAFRDRFAPMLKENVPELIPPGGKWMTLSKNHRIELTSAIIYGAASTLARQLTSRTAGFIYYDETDTGEATANSLGNVLDVADDRQMALGEGEVFTLGSSSAKYETGSNWVAYSEQSDRRVYWEPCPECGLYQELPAERGLFERRFVTVDDEREPNAILKDRLARFVCEGCGCLIGDEWQGWMCDRGVWVPAGQRITERLPLKRRQIVEHDSLARLPDGERWEPNREGPEPNNPHRGYRIWAANTKAEQRSWSHMLARWFRIAATKDPEKLQVFTNSWKSLPWKSTLKGAEEEQVKRRIAPFKPNVVPARAKLVLGAYDVQEVGEIHYAFFALGKVDGQLARWRFASGTRRVIGERFDLALAGLYEDHREGWPIVGADPRWRMRPYAIAVDSGYRTGDVYEFSRRPGVVAVRGKDDADFILRYSEREGKLSPEPVDLYTLNVKVFGNRLHALLIEPPDQSGGLWLHEETSEDEIRQLAAEELRQKKGSGRTTWQPKTSGRPNHHTDIARYILALEEILEQTGEVSLMALGADDDPIGIYAGGEPVLSREAERPRPIGGESHDPYEVPDWDGGAM